MRAHETVQRQLPGSKHKKKQQQDQHQDGETQLGVHGVKSALCVDEDDGANQDGYLEEDGQAGEQSQDNQDAAHQVCQGYVMRKRHGVDRHLAVGNHGMEGVGVLDEKEAFKKNDATHDDPENAQPLGLVGISPFFDFDEGVHGV